MGVLTDFVLANRADVAQVGDSACPYTQFDGIDAKGIDTVRLATLDSILTSTPYDPSFMANDCLFQGDEGPWVFEVPPVFVKRLASLTAEELIRAGTLWAATEEFSPQFGNWPPDAVHEMLARLVALSRRAVEARKSVLMWTSL